MVWTGSLEELARKAEIFLSETVPGTACVAQEWDDRIDCLIQRADGTVCAERVPASELTEERLRTVAERLLLAANVQRAGKP